ncbi:MULTISPECIES: 4a-hydroxytetrahydrobiopterin dehydratase [Halolamina]|uniref:Putative pterin-4-alpha-carbinolamine dehydratase n=1 Tax=Halolamina pelagica TaxID=699431 RepID=A0A1I5SJN6_9EURY|nr:MULTISPECIES: 4a-hydroxytetrahydrobiopterin dehydratase [Halolamina]NHX37043.1 4a-hydroxytetrahydrobiopterin dehydratase [Halolamina sp. R1-12]SFP70576.1 4a-hydroxytetrahydrobiopterin dehydratase [Halolamina pelagica]
MADPLDDDEIERKLPEDWRFDGDEIIRTYEFDSYGSAVRFVNDVADLAEAEAHHPEITLRYDEVEVRFTTHEVGNVTEKDLRLADYTDGEY